MKRSLLFVLVVWSGLAACGGPAAPPSRPTPPPAPTPAPAAAPVTPHAATVAGLVGAWAGRADTPFGKIPFGIEFVRESDDVIHGRVEQGPTAYLDFRFVREADGRWLLHEQTAFPGLGQRGSTLTPGPGEDAGAAWVSEEPSYLALSIATGADALTMVVRVRGKEHARFELQRRAALSSR